MKARAPYRRFFLFSLIAFIATHSAAADIAPCPDTLKWTDGTYMEATIRQAGITTTAAIEQFANATVSRADADNNRARVISLNAPQPEKVISFTSGKNGPAPQDFAELIMIVWPPWAEPAWPGVPAPCALAESTTRSLDHVSAPNPAAQALTMNGEMTRQQASIQYWLKYNDTGAPEADTVSIAGVWRYSAHPAPFPLTTDVQGWNVFRGKTYLMTIRKGKPVTIAKALELIRRQQALQRNQGEGTK